jgi:malate dehydrogenase
LTARLAATGPARPRCGIHATTPAGSCFSAAVCSDGSYGVEAGLISGFPLVSDGKKVSIVKGQTHDAFAQSKIDITVNELKEERECVKDLLK